MKLKSSPFFCRAKYFIGHPSCAGIWATVAFSFLHVPAVRAETRVWDGGATVPGSNGTGILMGTAGNWGTPGNPAANALPVTGDTLEFNGFDSTTTDLNMNAAFFAVPGAFAAINVNQANPLTFAAITNTSYLRMASGSSFTVTNGAVTFNAGRIVFGVGTGTTESFTLTNNSTSPVTWGAGAATPIAVGTGPAAGGGRNMTFAGSGSWVFDSKFDGAIAVVTKTGTGTLTLNAAGNTLANVATTPLTISQGSIIIGGSANMNAGAYASPIHNSAALVYSSNANQTLSGGITGTGSLEKSTSTSTLTLAGTHNYSGPTTLTSGTLAFTGDSTVGSLSVADQTTLAVRLSGPSVSPLKPSSLTFGVAPTDFSHLNVDFASSTNPTVPVIDLGAGSVTLNETVDISLSGLTALKTSTNTIKLLNYSSVTGAGSFNLLTTSLGHSTFALNQTATALFLNITAEPNIWKGAVDDNWDVGILNWSLPGGYLDGDTVVFNDTASVTSIDLPFTVVPGSVTFSNSSAKTYTLASATGSGIAGTGPLTLNGTNGTVILTTNNTYTGTTTIGAGNTLRLGDGTTDGSITNTAAIINNGTLVYNRIGDTFIYSGVISGSGSLVKEGAGIQRVGVANTYSGGTTINGGDLQIYDGNSLGTGPLTLAAGSLTARIASRIVPNPATVSGDFTVNNSGAGNNILTLSGNVDLTGGTRTITVANIGGSAITGVVSNGGLTKAGTGTLTLAGVNTYTGPTLISEGRLQIGNGVVDGNIDSTSSIVNNGTLAYNLVGPHTVGMPISGIGALVKTGAGTLTLTGANTYAGPTTISGGTLALASPYLADSAAVVIGSGAVLNLNYTGTDQVVSLTVGGAVLPQGLYTKDSVETRGFITGDGKIQVAAVAGGYASWAAANAPGQTKDQDHDNDGVANGIEYFMGAAGSSFTATAGLTGGSVTWTKGGSYTGTYGTDFVVQSSPDLVKWSPVPEVGAGVVNAAGSVSYTPLPGQTKTFTRLVVNN